MKNVQIRSFFGSVFSAFGLNTEIYGVNLRISPDTGKYGPEKTRYLDISHSEGKKIDIVFMTALFKLIFKMDMEAVIKLLMHLTC